MGRETIEKESLRGEAAESSGKHLGAIWDPFRSPLGAIWETSGRTYGEEASGGQISYYVPHSRKECKSSIYLCILRSVFEGQITKYRKLQQKTPRGSLQALRKTTRPYEA